jgi:hypothetical protein
MEGEAPEDYTPDELRSDENSPGEISDGGGGQKASGRRRHIPNGPKALSLISALSLADLVIGPFVGSFIPFSLLPGFSVFYSVEKWSGYYTGKHKIAGRI